ncbi:MAG: hypothetical protein RLZZ148_1445 [Cyanobacteriota bacterium]
MLLYIIAYDIPCDKRRKKIADLLEGYGSRVQYSVFECFLTTAKYNEFEEDSLRFYPLSSHTLSQVKIWGEPPLSEPPSSIII